MIPFARIIKKDHRAMTRVREDILVGPALGEPSDGEYDYDPLGLGTELG